MTRRRIAATVGLGAALALIAWIGTSYGRADGRGRESGSAGDTETPITVKTEAVTFKTEPVSHEVVGSVVPRLSADLAAKIMGRVVTVAVTEGDPVKAGQPLVWLESSDLTASVDQAHAAVRAAQAGASSAAVAATMEKAASDARIQAARAMVAQAEASLQSAKARRDLVRTGPRRQERAQAALAVAQAKAGLELAEAD